MQNYMLYIIGALLVLAIGYFIYSVTVPTTTSQQTQQTTDNFAPSKGQDVSETNAGDVNNTQNATSSQTTNTSMKDTYKVTMETNKGTIVLELNHKIAPKTVENFVKLSNSGFYDGLKFHRVIKDFMIQGGDPLTKDDSKMNMWGTGGPGYKFEDEITDAATYRNGYKRGILAMANSGPNTNGSQFFIMHKDVPLPPNYTIFGKVLSGLETVDAIATVQTGANDRPVDAVVIKKVTVQ
jgi:cyclophilin family peptidyl-prolyl cis-trans isomerase